MKKLKKISFTYMLQGNGFSFKNLNIFFSEIQVNLVLIVMYYCCYFLLWVKVEQTGCFENAEFDFK